MKQALKSIVRSVGPVRRPITERAVAAIREAGCGLFRVSNVGHEYAFIAGPSAH